MAGGRGWLTLYIDNVSLATRPTQLILLWELSVTQFRQMSIAKDTA